MVTRTDANEFIGKTFNSLTVTASSLNQIKRPDGYFETTVDCKCTCGDVSSYKLSYVITGRVKKCKSCNERDRIVKYHCDMCGSVHEKRKMYKRVNIGFVCEQCRTNLRSGTCKECGKPIVINGRHSHLCEKCWNFHRNAYNLLAACKERSSSREIPFDLDIDWIKNRLSNCSVTGVPLVIRDIKSKQTYGNYRDRDPMSPSIDKIDPSAGYTKDNCRVVCWWYNVCKQTWSDEEVLYIVKQWKQNKEDEWETL